MWLWETGICSRKYAGMVPRDRSLPNACLSDSSGSSRHENTGRAGIIARAMTRPSDWERAIEFFGVEALMIRIVFRSERRISGDDSTGVK